MLILITYDVSTEDPAGRKRLNIIAKHCVKYGQRVQNSVFECILDEAQYRSVQHILVSLMDKEKDSLRFYNLGNKYKTKVDHFGIKDSYAIDEALIV
ncbi:CRISPR-associated endoribonuclease Cas2 [bioreactor metagenome]|mgnify:FL=1|uniref:CRISPR-associated endoribonuclease Cas2 n=1 Tax=bioreactor metagenome TaxID=1076179 RepID=A0A645G4V0_9ZZZZ